MSEILIALEGIQAAVRKMVQHLGERASGPGQPPKWVRDQSTLRLVEMRQGSLIVDLEVEAPSDRQAYLDDLGNQAIAALAEWDGEPSSTLPRDVEDTLRTTESRLSTGERLSLGTKDQPERVVVKRKDLPSRGSSIATEALLQGWLYEVNWDKGTAQLHDHSGDYVPLRFSEKFHEDMRRYATQHVEVSGRGRLNDVDKWNSVSVESVTSGRSISDPFDIDAFLNNTNAQTFDAERVVTSSEPFDVDQFIRGLREGRNGEAR